MGDARGTGLQAFVERLAGAGYGGSYEAAHARLAIQAIRAMEQRRRLQGEGKLAALSQGTQAAADQSYVETANRLCEGLERLMASYERSPDARALRIARIYRALRSSAE
jgi:hypothetical protein